MKKTAFIHLGYPKTATTSLQGGLFSTLKNIHYIGKPYKNNKLIKSFSCLFRQDSFFFNMNENKKTIIHFIPKDKDILLSDETLLESGSTITADKIVIMKRLKHVFSSYNIKIILVIRSQLDMINSLYAYDRRKRNSYVTRNSWVNKLLEEPNSGILGLLDYSKVISILQKTFGGKNVKILLFEDFKYSSGLFYKDFLKFIKEKKSYMPKQNIHLNTRRGKFFFYYLSFMKITQPLFSIYKLFPEKIRERIKLSKYLQLFEKKISRIGPSSNLALSKYEKAIIINKFRKTNIKLLKFNRNIKKYNYPI